MGTCLKCGKECNNKKIYGIIEKHHHDDRTYDTDIDFGKTGYYARGIVELNYCDECIKKAGWGIRKESVKTAGIGLGLLIVAGLISNVSTEFGGILGLASFATIVFGLVTIVKSFFFKNKLIYLVDGKIAKENVLVSDSDGDLDVENLPRSNEYRDSFSYKYIDEKKLMEPIKEGVSRGYDGALNELKTWYKQKDSNTTKKINKTVDKKTVEPKATSEMMESSEPKKENKLLNKVKGAVNKLKNLLGNTKEKLKDVKMPKFSKKFGFIGLGIVLVIGLVIGIISITKTKYINVNDYIVFDVSGFEGDGVINVNVDYVSLIRDNYEKLEYKGLPDYASNEEEIDFQTLVDTIKFEEYSYETPFREMSLYDCDNQSGLSNGDVITYKPSANLDVLNKLFKCKFKAQEGTYTIDGLAQIVDVNIFDLIDESCVKYEGPNGYAYASIDMQSLVGTTLFESGSMSGFVSRDKLTNQYILSVCEDYDDAIDLYFRLSESTNLSNDQTIFLELDGAEELVNYGVNLKAKGLAIKVKDLPELIVNGEEIDKSMISSFLHEQFKKEYGNDITLSTTVRSALFFKMPDELQSDEPVIIIVDYDFRISYKDDYGERQSENGSIFGTIYNPCIKDGELCCSRYEWDDGEYYYGQIEEEYALVGESVNIEDYGEFLLLLDSNKTQKLIDAGYETREAIDAILYCFVNDSTHIIAYH